MSSPEDESAITIREATPADSDAIEELFIESPDEGHVSFAPRFSHDAHEAYTGLRPRSTGFVAETRSGRLAGIGYLSFVDARFGGEIRPGALLNAVAVHPDFRGRGLAKRIARHRIQYAREHYDEECVAFANIQEGNAPSRSVAESWATALAYDFRMYPATPVDDEPAAGYDVREATASELSDGVAASNRFHADSEVYRPYDADELRAWLDESPIEEPLHRYVVAKDGDEVVAGALAMDMYRVMKLVVESLPDELEAADELPPAIPESKELRMTMLSDLWYANGHEDGLRSLWQTVRARNGGANRIMLNYDPDGRVGGALATDGDEGAIEASVAVAGPTLDDPSVGVAPMF